MTEKSRSLLRELHRQPLVIVYRGSPFGEVTVQFHYHPRVSVIRHHSSRSDAKFRLELSVPPTFISFKMVQLDGERR